MCDHSPTFSVLLWNSAALDLGKTAKLPADYFNRLGEIIYGDNHQFRADVKFIATKPGFIVQEITRTLNVNSIIDQDLYKNSTPLKQTLHYWEIFYVGKPEGPHFVSYETDSFLLGEEDGNYENGDYSMTGISTFYPLSSLINIQYNNDFIVPSNELRNIFGEQTKFKDEKDYIESAGGLPASTTTQPTMDTLGHSYYQLVRTVTGNWTQSVDIVLNEQLYYRVYNTPSILCMPIIPPRVELLPDTDTNEKKVERIKLANLLTEFLPENEAKNITQEVADNLILKLISENYFPKNDNKGGSKKRKTAKKITKGKKVKKGKKTKKAKKNKKKKNSKKK